MVDHTVEPYQKTWYFLVKGAGREERGEGIRGGGGR